MKNKDIEILTEFQKGQLDILLWIKNNIQAEKSVVENKNVGYFLRETQKDTLYPAKILIHQAFAEHVLEQIENRIEDLEK